MYESLNTISLVLIVGGAVWFLYGPYQTFCEDRARQNLFEIRNAIFDLAAEGKLSFESEVYHEIRDILNSFIRYAHHLSAPRLAFYMIFMPQPPKKPEIGVLLEKIEDAEVQNQIRRYFGEAVQTLTRLLLWRSPILFPMIWLIKIVADHVSAIRKFAQNIKNRLGDKAISYSHS